MTHMFTKCIDDFIKNIESIKYESKKLEVILLFGLVYWFDIITGVIVWAILINDYYIYQNLCTAQRENKEIRLIFERQINSFKNTINELKDDLRLQKKYSEKIYEKIKKKLDENTISGCIEARIKLIENDIDSDSDIDIDSDSDIDIDSDEEESNDD